MSWSLLSIACSWPAPEPPPCDEPHLWYAPDASRDVYFGCAPPPGWLDTPPDEEQYVVAPVLSPLRDWVDVIPDDPEASARAEARDTSRLVMRDTGTTADTGSAPSEAPMPDTADTGSLGDTADTGPADTGLPPADTGAWEEEVPAGEGYDGATLEVVVGEDGAVDTAEPLPNGLVIEIPVDTGQPAPKGDDGT